MKRNALRPTSGPSQADPPAAYLTLVSAPPGTPVGAEMVLMGAGQSDGDVNEVEKELAVEALRGSGGSVAPRSGPAGNARPELAS